jgi:uncharacterized membrane protein
MRLRAQYEAFSAILFSGAMASVYFTTYAAYVYYAMLPNAATFILMIGFTIFTVYQALSYNRKEIALLGLVGAYAIPFLISKNADRPELFFLYITLINTAVVFLTFKKGWKLVGFVAQHASWLLFLAGPLCNTPKSSNGQAPFSWWCSLSSLASMPWHHASFTSSL